MVNTSAFLEAYSHPEWQDALVLSTWLPMHCAENGSVVLRSIRHIITGAKLVPQYTGRRLLLLC